MNLQTPGNDYSEIVEADRAHVWHHLAQHKKFETIDPLVHVPP
jgi:taurine-pyruvate aminotransferase